MEVFLDKLSQTVLIAEIPWEMTGRYWRPGQSSLQEKACCTFRFQVVFINGGYLYAVK